MPVFTQAPESKFAFVVVAGKRARQLMLGATPLLANPRSHKIMGCAWFESPSFSATN